MSWRRWWATGAVIAVAFVAFAAFGAPAPAAKSPTLPPGVVTFAIKTADHVFLAGATTDGRT